MPHWITNAVGLQVEVVAKSPGNESQIKLTPASAISTKTQQRSLSANGTTYMSVPLAGEYWRVSVQTTGGVTTTVKATLRR